jgi:hypothetical protein
MNNDFCNCDNPHYEDNEIHSQEGGEIVARVIGRYCISCGGWEPAKEPEYEE